MFVSMTAIVGNDFSRIESIESIRSTIMVMYMESSTFPIEYKNSPFDKSTESIESTKVYGALLLRISKIFF